MTDRPTADELHVVGSVETAAVPAVIDWANPDTGPESLRLYALDAGPSPRWAEPHARTVETAIRESAAFPEGSRAVVVVVLPSRTPDATLADATRAALLAVADVLAAEQS